MNQIKPDRPYHHGDLAASLRTAARAILEKEGLSALSLRSVARLAGVSHAAPYRHYPSREASASFMWAGPICVSRPAIRGCSA
jgi:AcrR family transcriptional regulator